MFLAESQDNAKLKKETKKEKREIMRHHC